MTWRLRGSTSPSLRSRFGFAGCPAYAPPSSWAANAGSSAIRASYVRSAPEAVGAPAGYDIGRSVAAGADDAATGGAEHFETARPRGPYRRDRPRSARGVSARPR